MATISIPDSFADCEDCEVNRYILTKTLFRCIGESQNAEEIRHLRAQVVSLHMPVADGLAHRFFGHGEIDEDLQQVAYLALSKAVVRFDSRRGAEFVAYAAPTVLGELKKHLRDHCWTVRPPRRVQDLQRQVSLANEDLIQQLQRFPTIEEIAERVDARPDDVTDALCARGCFTPASLDVTVGRNEDSVTFADLVADDSTAFERCEGHMLLEPLLRSLTAKDRTLLAMRFIQGCTQVQIAEQLQMTQIQVSRRLSRLLGQMRKQIEEQPADDAA